MIWLYRFINGYLRVLFYGEFSEKILNICAQNRIALWDSRLVKKGIETNISLKNFKALRPIMRGSKVRVHIIKRVGLPFKVAKNNKRIGMAVGLVLFFSFLQFMSGFIWIIDVSGNSEVKPQEILSVCEGIGITKGVRKSKIEPKNQREKLLLKMESLAWASLNIEGSRLTVNVTEVKEKESSIVCNLKASADGIIKKVDVTSGNCLVKPGDTVKQGDVLVSGVMEKLSGTEFVAAAGSIIAVTKKSVSIEGEYRQSVSKENGIVKQKRVLEFFGFKIPLYLGCERGEYESKLTQNSLKLFGTKLPITVHKRQFTFLHQQQIVLSEEELRSQLENRLAENMGQEEFETESINFTETENGIKLEAIITTEENIAYKDPILISSDFDNPNE